MVSLNLVIHHLQLLIVDTTGITTDKESPYVVKNAGVEFNKANDDKVPSLLGHHGRVLRVDGLRIKLSSWSSCDFEFPKSTFYENLEKSHDQTNSIRRLLALHLMKVGSIWSVQLPTTCSFWYWERLWPPNYYYSEECLETLNALGLTNTPLSFSSAWITGKGLR